MLSYPGNFQQLEAIQPDLAQLSTNLTWATDQTTFLEKTTWSTGTTDSQSTSFDQNYSFNGTLSVSGSTNEISYRRVQGDAEPEWQLRLQQSAHCGDDARQVDGHRRAEAGNVRKPPDYQYFVTPFIFGQQRPAASSTTFRCRRT